MARHEAMPSTCTHGNSIKSNKRGLSCISGSKSFANNFYTRESFVPSCNSSITSCKQPLVFGCTGNSIKQIDTIYIPCQNNNKVLVPKIWVNYGLGRLHVFFTAILSYPKSFSLSPLQLRCYFLQFLLKLF